MSDPDLLGESPPPAELVVSAWLSPWARGTRRRAGDPVPFRMIHTVAGSEDPGLGLSEATVSVHTFAGSAQDAMLEADKTHRRMLLLARQPLDGVHLPDGRTVCVDFCAVVMPPTEVDYDDPNVVRYVARYDLGLVYTS